MNTAFLDNYRFLARYNRWMNQRLYDACQTLSDEERKRQRGAFFGSIHHTLTHLVLASAFSRAVSCTPGRLVPSTRTTVKSVMPRKPSTVCR